MNKMINPIHDDLKSFDNMSRTFKETLKQISSDGYYKACRLCVIYNYQIQLSV